MPILIALACTVLLALAGGLRATVRARGPGRLWWGGCTLLMAIGVAGVVVGVVAPPEEFDADGNLIAEMPKVFAVGLGMLTLGLCGLATGLVGRLARNVVRRRR